MKRGYRRSKRFGHTLRAPKIHYYSLKNNYKPDIDTRRRKTVLNLAIMIENYIKTGI